MSPSTEQANLDLQSITDEARSLDSSRASSFLVRKWFPTGNLAWNEVPRYGDDGEHPVAMLYGSTYELVQEVYEVLFISDDEQQRTGNIEWRPIPILPPEPPQPEQIGMFLPTFDSPLLNRSSPQPEKSSQ